MRSSSLKKFKEFRENLKEHDLVKVYFMKKWIVATIVYKFKDTVLLESSEISELFNHRFEINDLFPV